MTKSSAPKPPKPSSSDRSLRRAAVQSLFRSKQPIESQESADADHHTWLLGVCDDLIEYCDTHDLEHSSNRLRYTMIAMIKDIERRGAQTA